MINNPPDTRMSPPVLRAGFFCSLDSAPFRTAFDFLPSKPDGIRSNISDVDWTYSLYFVTDCNIGRSAYSDEHVSQLYIFFTIIKITIKRRKHQTWRSFSTVHIFAASPLAKGLRTFRLILSLGRHSRVYICEWRNVNGYTVSLQVWWKGKIAFLPSIYRYETFI